MTTNAVKVGQAWRSAGRGCPELGEPTLAPDERAGARPVQILPPAQRSRVSVFVQEPLDDADYLLAHYRRRRPAYPYPEWRAIEIDGVKILTIFALALEAQ